MSHAAIDWSQYEPKASPPPQINWGNYESAPIAAPAQPSILDTLRREASAAGNTIASIPSSLYHAVIDPPTDDEIQMAGGQKSEVEGTKRVGLVIGRLVGAGQIQHAADFYKHFIEANPDQRNQLESDILSVAPEAFGSAAGTVIGGKLIESAPGAVKTVADSVPAVKDASTNAVRTGVRAANTVLEKAPGKVGAAAGAAVGAATHFPVATEVGAAVGAALGSKYLPKVRVPGESFGLPKTVQGGPATIPAEEVSQAPQPQPLAPTETPALPSPAAASTIPRTLSGESALREVLTTQPNKTLLQIAKSRGISVTQESALKPTNAVNNRLINKIVDDFSDDELDNVRSTYLEQSRNSAQFRNNVGKEANQVINLQTYFPELKVTQAALKRTASAMKNSVPAAPKKLSDLSGSDEDLTDLLQRSLAAAKR